MGEAVPDRVLATVLHERCSSRAEREHADEGLAAT